MRRGLLLLLVLCAALSAAAAPAYAQEPPDVAARAYLVADARTGEILAEENADARRQIASITKLMTALVVLDHARPREMVTVVARASSIGESTINLVPGERLSVRDLLAAALIQSANDAAFALAAHVGDGDIRAFVRLMNEKAEELGLAGTTFVRPDGLDVPGHRSTARDVLVLAQEAMEQPLIRRLVRLDSAPISGGRKLFGWNDLLGVYRGLFGVKTGHTDLAGWCQVGVARRDGATVYAVVLGSPTRERRNEALAELLDWGFDRFARAEVVTAGRAYAHADIPYSEERLELVAAEAAAPVLRLGRPLVETVVAASAVELPVRRGDVLGEVIVRDGERIVARRPLVAAGDLEEPGLGERAGWYAGRALDEAGDMLDAALGAIL